MLALRKKDIVAERQAAALAAAVWPQAWRRKFSRCRTAPPQLTAENEYLKGRVAELQARVEL